MSKSCGKPNIVITLKTPKTKRRENNSSESEWCLHNVIIVHNDSDIGVMRIIIMQLLANYEHLWYFGNNVTLLCEGHLTCTETDDHLLFIIFHLINVSTLYRSISPISHDDRSLYPKVVCSG